MAFTPQSIRAGLQLDPFVVRAEWYEAANEWGISWRTPDTSAGPGEEVAIAGFREFEDGIEWTRFHVREQFRGQGIYTQALKWTDDLGIDSYTMALGLPEDDWGGYSAHKSGRLKLDKRKAKARVKKGPRSKS